MKKFLLVALAVIGMAGGARAVPILCSTDTLTFGLPDLDSLGFKKGKVDSASFLVTGPKGDSIPTAEKWLLSWSSNSSTGTKWTVTKRSQSSKAYDTLYSAYAKVSDIVTASRYGMYVAHGKIFVNAATGKEWVPRDYEFQFVNNCLTQSLDSTGMAARNAKEALDSIKLYDNWLRDSVHNAAVLAKEALDSIKVYDNWLRDSVHNQSVAVLAVAATAANMTKAIDSINAILDSLQLYDNWVRDSVHNQSVAVLALVATAANLTKAIDSINAILDTLQLYDAAGHLSTNVNSFGSAVLGVANISSAVAQMFRDTAANYATVKGRVDSTTSLSDSTCVSNAFVEGANFWAGCQIVFFYGTGAKQSAFITKTQLTANSKNRFFFYPKLYTAPAQLDSFYIAIPGRGGYGAIAKGINDSTSSLATVAKASSDSVLGKNLATFSDGGVASSFFDSCLVWGRTSAGGLDSAFMSRYMRRIFGVSGGSDSLTQAQRTVTALTSVDSNLMYRQSGRAIHDSTATKGQLAQAARDSLLNVATAGYQTAGTVGKAIIDASTASGAPTALQIVQTLMAYRIDTCTGNFNLFGNRARAGLDTTKYVTVNQAVNSIWSHNIFANTYTDTTAGKLVRKMGMALTAIAKDMQVMANNYVADPTFAWYDTSSAFSFSSLQGGGCWSYYSNANVTSKLNSDLLYSRTGRYWQLDWTNSSQNDSIRLHNAYRRLPQGVYEFGLSVRRPSTSPGALPDTVIVFLMDSTGGTVIDSFRFGGAVTSTYNQAVQDSAWREISKLVTLSTDKTAKLQFRAASTDQGATRIALEVCYFFIRPLGGGSPSIMANAFWNMPFNTAFTPGSMGDSSNNASYMQGAAGTVTDSSIVASIRNDLALGHFIALHSDSGNSASAATFWSYGSRSLTDKAGFGLAQNERGAIGDTVWRKAFSELRDAVKYGGKIGYMLSDSVWLNNIQKIFGNSPAAQYLKQMFTGERAPLYLSLFDITGAGGSQGVMIVRNTSDGPGMAITGGDSTSTWAPAMLLTANGAAGSMEMFGGKSGPVMNLTSRDQLNNYAAFNIDNPYGVATRWRGANGSAGYGFISEGGRGVRFYGLYDNGFETISAQNHGWFTQGGTRNGASGWFATHQNGEGGYPVWLNSTRADKVAIRGELDTVKYARNGGGGGGGGGLWADTNAYLAYHLAHPEVWYGPFNTGAGIRTLRVFVIDTSQTPDRAQQGVFLTIANQAGADILAAKTESNGARTFSVDDGTYLIKPFMPGWFLSQKTVVIAGNADSVAVLGYNITSSSRTCAVWGTVTDDGGSPIKYATVTIAVPDALVTSDSSGVMQKLNREVTSDETGRFQFTVLRSSAIGGAKYTVTAIKAGYATRKTTFAAPDAANYRVYFK